MISLFGQKISPARVALEAFTGMLREKAVATAMAHVASTLETSSEGLSVFLKRDGLRILFPPDDSAVEQRDTRTYAVLGTEELVNFQGDRVPRALSHLRLVFALFPAHH